MKQTRKKIYFIPGTMCNTKLWTALIPRLDHLIEPVFLEIPRGKNISEIAEHYYDVLEKDKLNLVGFSLGGYIATYFSIKYQEQIEKLFIISNSPSSLPPSELKLRNDTLKIVEKYGYKGMSRKIAAFLLDTENRTENNIELILEMDRELGLEELVSQYRYTSNRMDLAEALSDFPKIAYFFCSEEDQLIDRKWLNKVASSNPNLTVVSTSGGGHMLPLEKPQELSYHINFWAQL